MSRSDVPNYVAPVLVFAFNFCVSRSIPSGYRSSHFLIVYFERQSLTTDRPSVQSQFFLGV